MTQDTPPMTPSPLSIPEGWGVPSPCQPPIVSSNFIYYRNVFLYIASVQ